MKVPIILLWCFIFNFLFIAIGAVHWEFTSSFIYKWYHGTKDLHPFLRCLETLHLCNLFENWAVRLLFRELELNLDLFLSPMGGKTSQYWSLSPYVGRNLISSFWKVSCDMKINLFFKISESLLREHQSKVMLSNDSLSVEDHIFNNLSFSRNSMMDYAICLSVDYSFF